VTETRVWLIPEGSNESSQQLIPKSAFALQFLFTELFVIGGSSIGFLTSHVFLPGQSQRGFLPVWAPRCCASTHRGGTSRLWCWRLHWENDAHASISGSLQAMTP
jgi:hypothetical protein